MRILIDNAHRATGQKFSLHGKHACRQNTAAACLADSLGTAVIHNNTAGNLGTKSQPALAELQTVFTAHEQGAQLFALQHTGNGILFGTAGNHQMNAAARRSLGSLNLSSHTAGTTRRAYTAGTCFNLRSDFRNLRHNNSVRMRLRISGIQAVHIRKNDNKVSIHNACNKSRHIIVIADFKLIKCHNVIFVDDRDNTLTHQFHKGITCICVTMAVNGLCFGNQHLRHNLTIIGKEFFVGVHQNALAYGSSSLLAGNSFRLARQSHTIHAHSHSTAGNQNHFLTLILQIADFARQTVNLTKIALAVGIGNRTRTNLDDNTLSLF